MTSPQRPSPQRRQALEVFLEWGPLPPRAIAAQLGISQEAARQLIRRMVKDGQLRPAEGDGRYRVVPKSNDTPPEAVQIVQPDDAADSHGGTPERHDVTEESNAVTEGEAVPERADVGELSRIGAGVFVYDHKTGGSVPWRNKALEGPYP